MTEKMIIDAYCRIRTIDNTIPDDVLDFMKNSAIEKLKSNDIVSKIKSINRFDIYTYIGDECSVTNERKSHHNGDYVDAHELDFILQII
jgi:hypothetical protein